MTKKQTVELCTQSLIDAKLKGGMGGEEKERDICDWEKSVKEMKICIGLYCH